MATPNSPLPLSAVRVNWPLAAANRLLAAVHAFLAAAAIAHRSSLLLRTGSFLHAAMLAADLVLLFLWALSQAPMWRPVSRAAFPDRLRQRLLTGALRLPGVDVVVVTADPDKEPAVAVMSTVVSAMALEHPGGRLAVYLSDDAGSPRTLRAARRAYDFASRAWVPFCRRYRPRCPCPDRYFAGDDQHDGGGDWQEEEELAEERRRVKKMYEAFREGLDEDAKNSKPDDKAARHDHDAYVEIITDDGDGGCSDDHPAEDDEDDETMMMPLLVYVSREKRKASPHHFKAGALNALLRVSSLVSNAPYVLALDCDMTCNTRSSILEAMCFHLDDATNHDDLAFVQFPQMFHNLSSRDIYANELRSIFATRWKGLDGLRGPILSGTGFLIRRDALYGTATPDHPHHSLCSTIMDDDEELRRRFGRSDHLLSSLRGGSSSRTTTTTLAGCSAVASCAFEAGTGWGDEAGFQYHSVVEDYFTGYRHLFRRGWTSVYCHPDASSSSSSSRRRPPFLGSVPTNLNDVLVQNKRWMSGLLATALSCHCPLASPSSLAVSVPQTMAFAYYAFAALYAFPVLVYGALAPLCLLRRGGGVPLFPDAGSPWFAVFAAAFASSALQHLVEVSVAKRRLAIRTWRDEQRFWMLNAVTGQLFACASVLLELAGAGNRVRFDLTSKAADGELYAKGVFDFTGCSTLLLPATTLAVLNAAALAGATWRMVLIGGGSSLSGELFLVGYVAALSYPLLEGMFLRQDAARVPTRVTAMSVAMAAVPLALFG